MKRILFALLLGASVAHAADVKISALPEGTTIAGTEAIPAVQSAATVKTTPAAIVTYANSASGTLTNKSISGATNTLTAIPASAVTAPGSTTQIVYNLAGALTGAAGLVFTDSASAPTLEMVATAGGAFRMQAATAGKSFTVAGGAATAGTGGGINIRSGAGVGSANAAAGAVLVQPGASVAGDTLVPNTSITGGTLSGTGGTGAGVAGSVVVTGGAGSNGATAGNVVITGGNDSTGTADGFVSVTTNSVERVKWLGSGVLQLATDPGLAGQVVMSNVTSAPTWQYPGGVTYFNSTTTGNAAGAGDTSAFSHSVAANTMSVDGQTLEFTTYGTFAATANTDKRIRAVYGATTIFDSGSLAIVAANSWQLSCKIMRTGAATQKSTCALGTSSSVLSASASYTTPTETLSGAVTLLIRLNGTGANDVVAQAYKEVCVR